MVLLKLRTWPPLALSQWLIGSIKEETPEGWTLTEACTIYEVLNNQQGNIVHQFVTDNLITQGELWVPKAEVTFKRKVQEGDNVLSGYDRAISDFRMARAGLHKAGPRPMQTPAPQGAQ